MRPTAELRLLASLGMALFCVTAAGVAAGPSKPVLRGPIKITAERAELERREYALYRGHVRLTSADMVLTGDRLELRQPVRGQYEARLTGAPARLDHAGDDKNPPVSASANRIVYDTRTATVDLSGAVQLARGTDQLSSGSVRYDVDARRISADGTGVGQVHITITPPPQTQKPAPPAKAPAQAPAPKTRSAGSKKPK